MLGPFTTASRLTPIHQMSLALLLRAACASMSTTTTTRDRGDRYGPMEWAQLYCFVSCDRHVRNGGITRCSVASAESYNSQWLSLWEHSIFDPHRIDIP